MAIPAIVYIGVASQVLPLVAILGTRGRHPPAPFRQLALLSCAFILSDIMLLLVARLYGYNYWVVWFMQPIEVGITLWLLSCWHADARWQRRYRQAIVGVCVYAGIMMFFIDPVASYDLYVSPVLSLVALGATLHTLVLRSLHSRELLTRHDWFWICAGLALFWLAYVPVDAFVSAFIHGDQALARAVLMARMALLPFTFALMTWGVLCKRFQAA